MSARRGKYGCSTLGLQLDNRTFLRMLKCLLAVRALRLSCAALHSTTGTNARPASNEEEMLWLTAAEAQWLIDHCGIWLNAVNQVV